MAITEHDNILLTASAPELLIPSVDTDVFKGRETASFWLGVVATPNEVHMPEEFLAARRLRANVYIDKYHFLGEDARQGDLGESDIDDTRSTQFAVIHNNAEDNLNQLVGTSRLIEKAGEDDRLPVERLFPEAFVDEAAPVGSLEASRFIAQFPNKMTQHVVSLSLMRSMAAHGYDRECPYIYAVIESHLARLFTQVGLPFEQISEEKALEEYDNTLNMAVRFNPREIFATVEKDTKRERIISTFFQNTLANMGVGYFDDGMIEPVA